MIFETDKIIIRNTELKDLDSIIRFEKENSDYVNLYTKNDHLEIIENECHLSIFSTADTMLIGHIILTDITTKKIEFRRIVISKKGFGYGNDALTLIKQMCYNKFNANKIWLDVYTDNIKAINLYKKHDFVEKEIISLKNSNRKLIVMENIKK